MTKPEGALGYALRVLRRRKIVFLVALISVPLAAYLVSASQQKEYTATATLLFESGEAGETNAIREAATNEALAGLPQLAVRTAKAMGGGTTADEILESVTVGAANEMANLTTISVTTPSPVQSARIANAYSRAYVAFRREEQTLTTGRTALVQTAGVPSTPSKPKTRRNVIIGILVGVILAFALAALLERIDRRVRTAEEMEELFGLPVLARIPRSRALASAFGACNIEDMLQAPEAEAFRTLRTNLRYLKVDRELHSILIASPEPNDGKSMVARGLAEAMAEMGDNVVLVEADLRKGGDFRDVNGHPAAGLSNLLLLVSPPYVEVLTSVEVQAAGSGQPRVLSILPSGPVPPNPGELIESGRMRTLIAELQERFDLVVIDCPALGVVSDVLALAPMASEILAVGGVGKTTRTGIRDFMQQLSLAGIQPIGLITNRTDLDRNKFSHYPRSGGILRR